MQRADMPVFRSEDIGGEDQGDRGGAERGDACYAAEAAGFLAGADAAIREEDEGGEGAEEEADGVLGSFDKEQESVCPERGKPRQRMFGDGTYLRWNFSFEILVE